MITYRLADSLPQKILSQLKEEFKDEQMDSERRRYIETMLDTGYGSCILQKPKAAKIVIDNWLFFNQKRYDLTAFVVMPNHVHLLIKTNDKFNLQKIVHSWKSYTANKIRESLAGWQPAVPGKLWQCDYWDRFIRNEDHFQKAVEYIHNNPVKAGLVEKPENWPWSSAAEAE